MLATLEMYDEAARPHPAVVRRNHQVYVRSGAQGVFYGKFRAGDAVRKDDVIGYTTDEFGKVLEEYEASPGFHGSLNPPLHLRPRPNHDPFQGAAAGAKAS